MGKRVEQGEIGATSEFVSDAHLGARIRFMASTDEILRGIDQLRRELAELRESFSSDEGLLDAKLILWTKRAYEQLKAWGFSAEAEQGFGRNSIINMYTGVNKQAKMRDDNLAALRDDVASHREHYESRLAGDPKAVMTKPNLVKPNKVFLGHGRSLLWHKVERYLEKDKKVPVEAWESESHTGEQVVAVLESFLITSTFAVLLVTGEDATAVGTVRARQNVIHEVGLFQGKLGFRKVALLVQEGTEDFSNIHGLQTILFPDQRIEAAFPELEKVLKREGVIK